MICNECRWKIERHNCPWDFMYEDNDYAEDCMDFRWIKNPEDAFDFNKNRPITQLGECLPYKQDVVGSSPTRATSGRHGRRG